MCIHRNTCGLGSRFLSQMFPPANIYSSWCIMFVILSLHNLDFFLSLGEGGCLWYSCMYVLYFFIWSGCFLYTLCSKFYLEHKVELKFYWRSKKSFSNIKRYIMKSSLPLWRKTITLNRPKLSAENVGKLWKMQIKTGLQLSQTHNLLRAKHRIRHLNWNISLFNEKYKINLNL